MVTSGMTVKSGEKPRLRRGDGRARRREGISGIWEQESSLPPHRSDSPGGNAIHTQKNHREESESGETELKGGNQQ